MLTINNPPGAANSLKNGFEYFEKEQNAHSFNSKFCIAFISYHPFACRIVGAETGEYMVVCEDV